MQARKTGAYFEKSMRWPRLWSGVLRLCDPRGLHRELGLIRCKLDLAGGFQVQIYLSQVVLALVHESHSALLPYI